MTHRPKSQVPVHQAAPFLAQLVACGLLGRAEAVAALLHAAAPARISPSGRQARLPPPMELASFDERRARCQAAAAVRRALAPLVVVPQIVV